MSRSVCAVVVAYNRKDLLRECLRGLLAQTRRPDRILVVNNASTDGTGEMVAAEFPQADVLNLTENLGGAGGFHEGMKRAFEQGHDWIWIMDDDGSPAPDCLERLLEHAAPNRVLVPFQRNAGGRVYGPWTGSKSRQDIVSEAAGQERPLADDFYFAFVGPMFGRDVVEQVGFPQRDFFIWFDDMEYAMRIHRRSQAEILLVPRAMMHHDFGGGMKRKVTFLGFKRTRGIQAAWKLYYGARNKIYTFCYLHRSLRGLLKALGRVARDTLGDVVFEREWRQRIGMRLRGARDGLLGRLGRRV